MDSRIFISYSRKDYDAVVKLREEIRRRTGVLPWMDVSGIETGAQFADAIAKAIDGCELLLFVISRHSVESPWTQKEVLYAQDQHKTIYPVVIDDARLPSRLKFLFADVNQLDLRNGVQREILFSNLSARFGSRTSSGKGGDRPAPQKGTGSEKSPKLGEKAVASMVCEVTRPENVRWYNNNPDALDNWARDFASKRTSLLDTRP